MELLPGGKDIPVTNENRIRYIYLMANYKLNIQLVLQSRAFLSGLCEMIEPQCLRMFNQVPGTSYDIQLYKVLSTFVV